MQIARVLLVVAGLIGIAAFFLPVQTGSRLSAYGSMRGTAHVGKAIGKVRVPDVQLDPSGLSTHDVRRDTSLLVRLLSLVFLAILLPSVALFGIGVAGFDRDIGGLLAVGAMVAGGTNLYMLWPPRDLDIGGYLLVVSGLLGIAGGAVATYRLRRTARAM